MINIDHFLMCEIKIGTIVDASFVEGADKLLCFKVNLGEVSIDENGRNIPRIRQILSGIRGYYPEPSVLIGVQVPVLCNLPTRKLRGLDSEGMILYVVSEGLDFTTLCPSRKVINGTQVG